MLIQCASFKKQQITESGKMFFQTTLAMYNSAVHQLILRVL